MKSSGRGLSAFSFQLSAFSVQLFEAAREAAGDLIDRQGQLVRLFAGYPAKQTHLIGCCFATRYSVLCSLRAWFSLAGAIRLPFPHFGRTMEVAALPSPATIRSWRRIWSMRLLPPDSLLPYPAEIARAKLLLADHALADGIQDQFGGAVQIQFLKDIGAVSLHGVETQI